MSNSGGIIGCLVVMPWIFYVVFLLAIFNGNGAVAPALYITAAICCLPQITSLIGTLKDISGINVEIKKYKMKIKKLREDEQLVIKHY